MQGKRPHEAAAQEAYEEAGVVGAISARPLGRYSAIKLRPNGVTEKLDVIVFPMHVSQRLKEWPEKGQRSVLWFEPADAARTVKEPELAQLIAGFSPLSFS